MFIKDFMSVSVDVALGQVVNQTQHVESGTTAVIACNIPSLSDYPQWSGPPVTTGVLKIYNTGGDSNFFTSLGNYERLSWSDNKKDLILRDVVVGDEGKYSCIKNSLEKWTVLLNVTGRILREYAHFISLLENIWTHAHKAKFSLK